MKLLFDKTTRRLMGSIEGSNKGLPTNLIAITGTMPTAPETAYLSADNVSVSVKPLSVKERAARTVKPNGKTAPAAKPTATDRSSAYNAIDTAAGNARLRYVTQGALQQQVYDIKAAEAVAYIAAGYPKVTTLYPLITAQASGTSTTVKIVADTIIATKTTWLALAGKIEALRISGKAAAKAAKTITTLQKVETDTIVSLESI